MKQEVLKSFDISWIPISGLIIFFICFGVYVYYTYKSSNKKYYDEAAQIPLNDENRVQEI